MTSPPSPASPAPLPAEVAVRIDELRPRDVAVGILTYNNAETVTTVLDAATLALTRDLPGITAAIINSDAGSADGTVERLAAGPLPLLALRHTAPPHERRDVPFHGIPGRGGAIRSTVDIAHRLGARVLVLLEPDVVSIGPDWIVRLAGPVLGDKADLVSPAYRRHRYEGTITRLLLGPLVRALYGRRLAQPFGGQQALSGRLLEHLLLHPRWDWSGRDVSDLWVVGAAIADGFSVWEAWLGPRTVKSRTRTTDLPAMVAQTLGSVFSVMHHHQDLWREVRGSEPLPAVGDPELGGMEPAEVDVERMIDAFRLGLRDLTPIWEHILAAETLGDVLSLDQPDAAQFKFPDDLWARVVYDFALGHHYGVVHRDHLLRSLVPLYLGRTAAFVRAAQRQNAVGTERLLEAVGVAFERQKPYLVEHWT